jgi:hypothetical protein
MTAAQQRAQKRKTPGRKVDCWGYPEDEYTKEELSEIMGKRAKEKDRKKLEAKRARRNADARAKKAKAVRLLQKVQRAGGNAVEVNARLNREGRAWLTEKELEAALVAIAPKVEVIDYTQTDLHRMLLFGATANTIDRRSQQLEPASAIQILEKFSSDNPTAVNSGASRLASLRIQLQNRSALANATDQNLYDLLQHPLENSRSTPNAIRLAGRAKEILQICKGEHPDKAKLYDFIQLMMLGSK